MAGNEAYALKSAIRKLTEQDGMDIFSDIERLKSGLEQNGVSAPEIKQVELVLETGEFCKYLTQNDSNISAIEMNNMILIAQTSGLSNEVVHKIVGNILEGTGCFQPRTEDELVGDFFSLLTSGDKGKVKRIFSILSSGKEEELNGLRMDKTIYVPGITYQENLKKIACKIHSKRELELQEFALLNYCWVAGIPAAARLLGELYLEGLGVDSDESRAVKYLKYAVSMGDVEAMALLGDYFYGKQAYEEAYRLYTSPGVYAVTGNRKERVDMLCLWGKLNKRVVRAGIGIALLIELVLWIVLSSSPITGGHLIARIICSVLNIGLAALLIRTNRKMPFFDLRQFSLGFALVISGYAFFYIMI